MAATALLMLALLLSPGAAHPRPAAAPLQVIQLLAEVDSLRQAARIPGLAVVVMRDTAIVAATGFGFADLESRTPVTADTPFDIASVSKPISAVVALRLVEAKRLDLDTPMRRFVGFTDYCEGARERGGIFFSDFRCGSDSLTLRHVLSMESNGEPGTRFWYNPQAYSWTSRPMAQVTGRGFSVLVDSLVFRPAGMTRSARQFRALPLRADLAAALARPYHLDSTGVARRSDPPEPQGDGAAGGVVATARDLAHFDQALMTGRLIDANTLRIMWTPGRGPSGAELPYGLGWFVKSLEGRSLAWHTGLWDGRYSALYLKVLSERPAERATLILLANSEGLQWPSRLDEAAVERSPFARAFLRLLTTN